MAHSGLDKVKFEEVFREYFPYLCSFAKKYLNNDTAAAKDIVHNVFINLWNKREEVDVSVSIKPYLFKSVHNRCLNYLRDNKRIVRHDLPRDETQVSGYIESTDYLEASELENRINEAINILPEKCREIFCMSRFDDKKYKEIADHFGISVKAVEAQMSKALKILREQLSDYLSISSLGIMIEFFFN